MCGVIGIAGSASSFQGDPEYQAAYEAYRGLLTLQHRGQDAAGLLSYDDLSKMFYQKRDLGLVAQVFDRESIENLTGAMAIGHTRYATTGGNGKRDIQPLLTGAPFGLGMVHNGNIVNQRDLADTLTSELKRHLLTKNDLEILLYYWSHYLLDGHEVRAESFSFANMCRATKHIFDTFRGGYAVIGLVGQSGMIAFRDPDGIRPMVLGQKKTENGETRWCISSETVALNYLGYEFLRDVAPGEFIYIDLEGNLLSAVLKTSKSLPAPCVFEWIYFSAAESTIENESVYKVRLRLGEQLGLKAQAAIDAGEISPDVVMPVPDTSRSAAIAAADTLGLPYREGLIKNRYVHRSFILNTQEKREEAVHLKLSPIRSEIEGKNILLIDDSVVRGTTSKRIIELLKKNGAKEIVLGITCPPIRHGCFYGIDFPDPTELVANEKSVMEIAAWAGARKFIYLDEDDLKKAASKDSLCMACLDGKYPTAAADITNFTEARRAERLENAATVKKDVMKKERRA
jgi:amidophosphoribosyltransferase